MCLRFCFTFVLEIEQFECRRKHVHTCDRIQQNQLYCTGHQLEIRANIVSQGDHYHILAWIEESFLSTKVYSASRTLHFWSYDLKQSAMYLHWASMIQNCYHSCSLAMMAAAQKNIASHVLYWFCVLTIVRNGLFHRNCFFEHFKQTLNSWLNIVSGATDF